MSLQAKGVTFGYPGSERLYRDFSCTVEAGERVALCGPSGAGKTTLCRLLAGYLRPQSGEISVDGMPLAACGPRAVQLIWQHPEQAFDPLMRMGGSLAEGACRMARDRAIDRARSQGLLEAFGIRDAWLARYPHELSGGELMRFCIARCLLAEPSYLICDEMTAMLDAVTQAQVWRAVLDIARDRHMGLVVVSHSPALLDGIGVRQVDVGRL